MTSVNARLFSMIENIVNLATQEGRTELLEPAQDMAKAVFADMFSAAADAVSGEWIVWDNKKINIAKFPRNYGKIAAIKLSRHVWGFGLKEAKELIEAYSLYDPESSSTTCSSSQYDKHKYEILGDIPTDDDE